MADTAKGNVDLHIVHARRAAVYLQRLQGFVTCMGAIGLNQDGDSFLLAIEGIFASPPHTTDRAIRWFSCLLVWMSHTLSGGRVSIR